MCEKPKFVWGWIIVVVMIIGTILVREHGDGKAAEVVTSVKPVSPPQVHPLIEMAASIQYVKDTRTNICFAYIWRGQANGGPALATVPCVNVEKLLVKDTK